MNKRIFSLVMALAMAMSMSLSVCADPEDATEETLLIATETDDAIAEEEKNIDIKLVIGEPLMVVDGDTAIELDVPPTIMNERTMLPLRAIFEALGAVVNWDDETKTIFAMNNYVVIAMQIGQDVMYVNGEQVQLDAPSVIVEDRTLVPVRAIAEAFGNSVQYDEETKTVTITN